jgi:hypothetical protein
MEYSFCLFTKQIKLTKRSSFVVIDARGSLQSVNQVEKIWGQEYKIKKPYSFTIVFFFRLTFARIVLFDSRLPRRKLMPGILQRKIETRRERAEVCK